MTALPSASRLSAAISELEQALLALDLTVNAASQSLPERPALVSESQSAIDGDIISSGQVREELVALQELVNSAAELIALARSGESTDGAPQRETLS